MMPHHLLSAAVPPTDESQTQAVIGVDPTVSRLWAQVKRGKPEMKVDKDGRLRHKNWPDAGASLYLGDVCEALLRCFSAHEPPVVTQKPGFDQQKWTMVIRDSTLRVEVSSAAYWGFGLFDSCFLNEVAMEGPLERRSRLIFDVVAALGRNPWEYSFGWAWRRKTGATASQHKAAWEGLLEHAFDHMGEEIHSYQERLNGLAERIDEFAEQEYDGWSQETAEVSLELAANHLDSARGALHDRNAAGLERALARVEAELIEADPTTEVVRTPFDEADLLLQEDVVEVDEEAIVEQVLVHEELPEELARSAPEEIATATDDVEAGDLLGEIDDVAVDEVPFVDLTESE